MIRTYFDTVDIIPTHIQSIHQDNQTKNINFKKQHNQDIKNRRQWIHMPSNLM